MSIVSILEKQLNSAGGNSEIIALTTLLKLGICSSHVTAKNLLKSGKIPFIRIGNRTLFARKDLVEFLHKCASNHIQE